MMKVYLLLISTTILYLMASAQRANTDLPCPISCADPAGICDCFRDGVVDCKARNLMVVPSNLHTCGKVLQLQNNRINQIGILDFYGLANATELNLSNNTLRELSAGSFFHLKSLKILHLENNIIRSIEECTFQGLFSLTLLDLKQNQINILPDRAFDGLPSLNHLLLYQNQLTTLHVRWFEDKPRFTSTLVGSNRWNCTCDLKNAYTTIIDNFNQTVHCPTVPIQLFNQMCILCVEPAALKSQFIGNISFFTFPDCQPSNMTQINRMTCSAKVEQLIQNVTRTDTTTSISLVTGVNSPEPQPPTEQEPVKQTSTEQTSTEQEPVKQISTEQTSFQEMHISTRQNGIIMLVTSTIDTLQNNSVGTANIKITTLSAPQAQQSLQPWVIALIIILAIILLTTGLLLAISVVRRKRKKQGTPNQNDLVNMDVGNKFTNKTFHSQSDVDDNGSVIT